MEVDTGGLIMSAEAGASVAPEAGATESGASEPPQAELSESEPEEEVVSEVASAARTDAVRMPHTYRCATPWRGGGGMEGRKGGCAASRSRGCQSPTRRLPAAQ